MTSSSTFVQEKKKEEIFFRALNLDRPHFVTTFIKLNFDLPRMFYQKKVNRGWELRETQLTGLYNYNQAKQVEICLPLFIQFSSLFPERSFVSLP